METRYFVGLDLGKRNDVTALAVIERVEKESEGAELRLRYLERVEGTSYPEIVERVREVVQSSTLQGQCELAVNAAGAGRHAVDLLHRAQLGCLVRPVMVTCGRRERIEGDWSHVPNRDLLIRLRNLFRAQTFKIAKDLPYSAEMRQQMPRMRVTVSFTGNEQYDAWREGDYDDLVFAVALACWAVEKTCGLETGTRTVGVSDASL